MNKVSLAVPGGGKAKPEPDRPAPKQQSHIRQARQQAPAVKAPETGPMAAMLKRLFGSKDDEAMGRLPILPSEDLQAIQGLTIVNPFAHSPDQIFSSR